MGATYFRFLLLLLFIFAFSLREPQDRNQFLYYPQQINLDSV